MSTDPPTTVSGPPLGGLDERCAQCDSPLVPDQRYCLHCGYRRAPMRLAFAEVVTANRTAPGGAAGPRAPLPPGVYDERSPLVALVSLIALLLALGIGVLVGRGTGSDPAPARAQIVTVAAPPAAAGGAGVPAAIVSDWPTGTEGWTLQLQSLPATATAAEVAQAKQDATAKGAAGVGALKSDEYPSLPPAQIVVYSGTYESRAEATSARKDLPADFAEATIVEVAGKAADAAEETRSTPTPQVTEPDAAPQDPAKPSQTAPQETQGPPPKVNDDPPGAGGDATVIG